MNQLKICFVCTGNICRSPMAAAVLKSLAEKRNIDLVCASRGVARYHVGDPIDRRARAALNKKGYDDFNHRAKQISFNDFKEFDVLVAMDSGHYMELEVQKATYLKNNEQQLNHDCPRIIKFTQFLDPPLKNSDVPDPYYGSYKDFEKVLSLIEKGAESLIKAVENKILLPCQ